MRQLLGHSKLSTTQKSTLELEGERREAKSKMKNLV
jgi:hypothetical protein